MFIVLAFRNLNAYKSDTPIINDCSILALAQVKKNVIKQLQELCQLSPASISHQHLLEAKVIQVVNGKTHALQMHQEKSAMPGIMKNKIYGNIYLIIKYLLWASLDALHLHSCKALIKKQQHVKESRELTFRYSRLPCRCWHRKFTTAYNGITDSKLVWKQTNP